MDNIDKLNRVPCIGNIPGVPGIKAGIDNMIKKGTEKECEMRETCLFCALKHLAQALILMQEAKQGYPLHRWLAVGHMAEASDEVLEDYPELANEIRKIRVMYIDDASFEPPIMDIIKKLDEMVKEQFPNGSVNQGRTDFQEG